MEHFNLENYAKYFKKCWACIPCTEKGGNTEFKYKHDILIHIQSNHLPQFAEQNLEKMSQILSEVSKYDEWINTSSKFNMKECKKKMLFFVRQEENLNILDKSSFERLLKQIRSFYDQRGEIESLLDWNYGIEINNDSNTGKYYTTIIDLIEDYSEEEDDDDFIDDEIEDECQLDCNNIPWNDSIEESKDAPSMNVICSSSEDNVRDCSDICDVTLACEDKQHSTHEQIISYNIPVLDFEEQNENSSKNKADSTLVKKDPCERKNEITFDTNEENISYFKNEDKNDTFYMVGDQEDSQEDDLEMTENEQIINVSIEYSEGNDNKKQFEFSCNVCTMSFPSNSELREHEKEIKEIADLDYTCNICDYKTRSEEYFYIHEEVCQFDEDVYDEVTENKIISLLNQNGYKTDSSYSKDVNIVFEEDQIEYDDSLLHTENIFVVKIEKDQYSYIDQSIKQEIDEVSFKSEQEETKSFKKKRYFDMNIRICDVCRKTFTKMRNFESHMKSAHENKGTVFPCDVCMKDFISSYDLKSHIESVHRCNEENETNIQELIIGKKENPKTKKEYRKRKKRKWRKENQRRKRKKKRRKGRR